MDSGVVTSRDGTRIGFDRQGVGPALVLVDPAGCYRGFSPLGELATALAGRFTVLTYDRRGRGESTDTLPYAVQREVEDLQAVIGAAGGSAAVYGFSSGAVLALHAAAAGTPISKLALLEPPLSLDGQDAPGSDLRADIARLVAEGRRGEAVEHFQTSIGVPAEMIDGIRQSPAWPALEGIAHTLVYDLEITGSPPAGGLSTITVPTLVLDSEGSDDRLRSWARGVADALPDARYRSLEGGWHGPSGEDLVQALVEFLTAG